MASASDTALGINELVSTILSLLPKKDLKSARLVRKRWASLGGQMLIGTLYISPREIDMTAFEGITKHLDLAKSVKHVVYDSAQFFNFGSAASYYAELYLTQQNGAYLQMGDANAAIERFNELIHGEGDTTSVSGTEFSPLEPPQCMARFKENICHESFIEGFLQYSLHFQERGNILRPSWFNRVVRGLGLIGPIDSVAARNTWNDIYDEDEIDEVYEDQDIIQQHPHWDYWDMRSCNVPMNRSDPDMDRLVKSGRIQSNGRRVVGSPSARAYPPTGLQPLSPKPMNSTPDAVGLLETGLSDSRWELVKLVELLHASGQKPLQLEMRSDIETMTGIPARFFNAGELLNAGSLIALADNLRTLHLELSYHPGNPAGENLQILVQFLQKATRLRVLTLELPPRNIGNFATYRLNQIFKPIDQWIRPTLTKLVLALLSTGYEDLSRLIFFNLPHLRNLQLFGISLLDGIWENIVEGLHQIVPLTMCKLYGALYQSNGKFYCSNDTATTNDELTDFLAADSRYVMEGGTHPRSPMYVPSHEFKKDIAYWKQLRGEFERARASGWDSGNPWSLDLPSRNH
ncbi:MAG: hypothetical protein Q9199_004145 [Rusavskia elegans]